MVADCDQYFSDDECEANTRLIAAAPELLAALEQAVTVIASDEIQAACQLADLHGMPYGGPTVNVAELLALLAKARGEAAPTPTPGDQG